MRAVINLDGQDCCPNCGLLLDDGWCHECRVTVDTARLTVPDDPCAGCDGEWPHCGDQCWWSKGNE